MSLKLTLGALLVLSAGFGAGYFAGGTGGLQLSENQDKAASGPRISADLDGSDIAARGANTVLYVEELADLTEAGRSAQDIAIAARQRLLNKAFAAAAEEAGESETPAYAAAARAAAYQASSALFLAGKARASAQPATEDALRQLYEASAERLTRPVQVRLRQIYIAADNETPEAKAAAAQRAAELHQQISDGEITFEEAARAHSAHSQTADAGGDLGAVSVDTLIPQVRQALDGRRAGDLIAPVEVPRGYQILRVEEVQAGETLTFEEARASLTQAYRAAAERQAQNQIIADRLREDPLTLEAETIAALVSSPDQSEAVEPPLE